MSDRDTAPELLTARLLLRPHRLEDFAPSAAMWADPAVVEHISGTPFTEEASWSRLLRYPGHWAMLGYGYWAIETRQDGRFVGEVGLADYRRALTPPQVDAPEAGWVIAAPEQRKGYATEAVARVLAWADRHLDVARTFCMVDPKHAASIGVARKVGYGDDTLGAYRGVPVLILSRSKAAGPTNTARAS